MPLTRQTQVLDGLDGLGGAALRGMAREYRAITGPLVQAVKNVKLTGDDAADQARLLEALGPKTFRKMDSTDVETRIADALFQSGAIGVVAAATKQEAQGTGQKGTADKRG